MQNLAFNLLLSTTLLLAFSDISGQIITRSTIAQDCDRLKKEVTLTKEQERWLLMLKYMSDGRDSIAIIIPPARDVPEDKFQELVDEMFSELQERKATYGQLMADVDEYEVLRSINLTTTDSINELIHEKCLNIHNADTAKIKFVYEPRKLTGYCPYLPDDDPLKMESMNLKQERQELAIDMEALGPIHDALMAIVQIAMFSH